ncbi:SurA N-terminal domain-containing protein [Streptacidiphilus monticola]|uniref:SurA N-terminal domain-containing protein n=1 Tax=Streptacidiphilus monticola TaxID=2161674 RepID=A0ABW1FY56_9ACTN
MRRRPVLVLAGAGAVLAALSACSGTAQTGAAAVVGGQRITVASVEAQVADYRAAVGQATAVSFAERVGQADPQRTLDLLIQDRVAQGALARAGLTVTQGEIDRAEAAYQQQFGSREALAAALAKNVGVSPNDLDVWMRLMIAQDKLLRAAGVDPNDEAARQAGWSKLLAAEGNRLGVKVNPRYGSWSPAADRAIGPAAQPWLKSA